MTATINARELRRDLAEVVRRVRQGQHFTVLYRSRVAFDIVPPGESRGTKGDLAQDSIFKAPPVGSSADGRLALKHDEALYG